MMVEDGYRQKNTRRQEEVEMHRRAQSHEGQTLKCYGGRSQNPRLPVSYLKQMNGKSLNTDTVHIT